MLQKHTIPRDQRHITDTDFFNALDLTHRGLAPVRKALRAGNTSAARREIVAHFKRRPRPCWFFDFRDGRRGKAHSFWAGHTLRGEKEGTILDWADAALENRFYVGAGRVLSFGPRLRWRTSVLCDGPFPANAFKWADFLRVLALAHARTRKPVYAAKFAELTERWLDDWPLVVDEDFDPDHTGVIATRDSHRVMPTAFRALGWLDALYSGVLFAPEVPTSLAFRLIKAIWFTALQFRRFDTGNYRPANHHIWHHATIPCVLGTMFPEFPGLQKLADQGHRALSQHVARGFLPDGGYEERCSGYTWVALMMFLMPLELARRNRQPLLDRTEKARVRRACDVHALALLPDGLPPDIGDHTGTSLRTGRLLGKAAHYAGSRTSATIVRRLGLVQHMDPDDRAALQPPSRSAAPLTLHYPHTGLFVARDGWSPHASAMALSVPTGGLPNHAHDDALSLQLVVRGLPFVGTPATELYHKVHERRYEGSVMSVHHRARTSHNVVLVHGVTDPRESWNAGNGSTSFPVDATVEKLADGTCIHASYRRRDGTTVSRAVRFSHHKSWTVTDRITAKPGRHHLLRWHFDYGVDVQSNGDHFLLHHKNITLTLHLTSSTKHQSRLYRDTRWLAHNPQRNQSPPWILDTRFKATGKNTITTTFTQTRTPNPTRTVPTR